MRISRYISSFHNFHCEFSSTKYCHPDQIQRGLKSGKCIMNYYSNFSWKLNKESYVNPRRNRVRPFCMYSLFRGSIEDPIIIVHVKEIYFTISFYSNKLLTHSPFSVVVCLPMFHISLCLDLTFLSRPYFPLMTWGWICLQACMVERTQSCWISSLCRSLSRLWSFSPLSEFNSAPSCPVSINKSLA